MEVLLVAFRCFGRTTPIAETISLASLLKLQPVEATFENLAERVAELARGK